MVDNASGVVTIYKNVYDKQGVNVKVSSILKGIRDGRWYDQIKDIRSSPGSKRKVKKEHLPSVCFCGTFDRKKEDGLNTYSGIMVIDIDEKKGLKKIRSKMQRDNSIMSFFYSPSLGLKVLFKVNTGPEEHKRVAFPHVKDYVEMNYGVEVDRSGKNINRLCFISYDPELFYNPDHNIFDVDRELYTPKEKEYKVPKDAEIKSDASDVFLIAFEWTQKQNPYIEGNKDNSIHHLGCILNEAGVTQDEAIDMIEGNLTPPDDRWKKNLRNQYKRNAHKFGTKPVYRKKGKVI